jgi:hypothetical protein
LPVAALHGGNDQMRDACGLRSGAHGISVRREFGRIQVAMGIDPSCTSCLGRAACAGRHRQMKRQVTTDSFQSCPTVHTLKQIKH